jgi:hypothetical protein
MPKDTATASRASRWTTSNPSLAAVLELAYGEGGLGGLTRHLSLGNDNAPSGFQPVHSFTSRRLCEVGMRTAAALTSPEKTNLSELPSAHRPYYIDVQSLQRQFEGDILV